VCKGRLGVVVDAQLRVEPPGSSLRVGVPRALLVGAHR